MPEAKWSKAVRALVVLRPGASVSPEKLTALVRERKGAVYPPKAIDPLRTTPACRVLLRDKTF